MNSTISESTPLIPELLAEVVIAEAFALVGDRAMEHEPAAYLVARAEKHYQTNAIFAKKLHAPGDEGREFLLAFLRHWLAGHLLKHGVPRDAIPPSWMNGHAPGPRRPLDLRPGLTDR